MNETRRADTSPPPGWAKAVAILFGLTLMGLGYLKIGLPPVVIVGGSAGVGFVMWLKTYRYGAIDPQVILPPFLLTVCALEIHMIEEYYTGFAPAMSRLFDISWSQTGFLVVFTFAGPVLYSLTALGLFRRIRLAGFMAWFIFIGPGVAELTHFIFPLITPAIQPHDLAPLTRAVGDGVVIADMRNYSLSATGRYYFPGMYTAILPMMPGIYGIVTVLAAAKRRREQIESNPSFGQAPV